MNDPEQTRREINALSIEQMEQLLELRDSPARPFPGAAGNKTRKENHAQKWERHALELIQGSPSRLFDIPGLANDVAQWCETNGITKKNGKPYTSGKSGTIYRHLLERRTVLMRDAGIHRV